MVIQNTKGVIFLWLTALKKNGGIAWLVLPTGELEELIGSVIWALEASEQRIY